VVEDLFFEGREVVGRAIAVVAPLGIDHVGLPRPDSA
jgi:hypothetical protein